MTKEQILENLAAAVVGGQVSPEWAAEIGADGHGKSAIQAVETATRLLGQE